MSFLFGLKAARLCVFVVHPALPGMQQHMRADWLVGDVYQREEVQEIKSISRVAAPIRASTVSLAQGDAPGGSSLAAETLKK